MNYRTWQYTCFKYMYTEISYIHYLKLGGEFRIYQGAIGCTPNVGVPTVFVVFSMDSWRL